MIYTPLPVAAFKVRTHYTHVCIVCLSEHSKRGQICVSMIVFGLLFPPSLPTKSPLSNQLILRTSSKGDIKVSRPGSAASLASEPLYETSLHKCISRKEDKSVYNTFKVRTFFHTPLNMPGTYKEGITSIPPLHPYYGRVRTVHLVTKRGLKFWPRFVKMSSLWM